MGKHNTKHHTKNQHRLAIGVGGKWEKAGKKKLIKLPETLQPIHEEEAVEEKTKEQSVIVHVHDKEEKQDKTDGENVEDIEPTAENVKILLTKRKSVIEDEDDQDTVIETLRNAQDVIEYWIYTKLIEGVIDVVDKNKVLTDVTCYSDWISEPKVTGKAVIRVEVFFTIKTKTPVRDLVQSQLDFLQRENIRIEIKRTNEEHTTRIGYLVGPVVDWANMNWYERTCIEKARVEKGNMELKKEPVYEGAENERCITIHGIRSEKDNVDTAMRMMKLSGHIKYVSFNNSTKNERIGTLQLNKCINIKLKYECLEDVGVLDEVEFNNEKSTLSEVIMSVKKEGASLFHGIEQGYGKNVNNTYVYFKGTRSVEAREWLRKNYGINLRVKDKAEYTTSLPKVTGDEASYHKDLNDYIISRMQVITIDENRNKAPKSYLEALTGMSESSSSQSDSDYDSNSNQSSTNMSNDSDTNENESESESNSDSSTKKTSQISQMTIIQQLQDAVKNLENRQQKLISHIESLEDTVIALSDSEEGSVEFKTAARVVKKIKRKRKEQHQKIAKDSDTSDDSRSYRRSPRFKKPALSNKNRPRYYKIEQNTKEEHNKEQNKEKEVEENKQNEES